MELSWKFDDISANICVVGYVSLPAAVSFAEKEKKTERWQKKRS